MYKQGDIILIPFPYTDLTGFKKRPALIISNEKINKTPDRICCLITSHEPDEGIKIKKEHFENKTLPFQSWVKAQRIFTIHEKIILKKLSSTTKAFQRKIKEAIEENIEIS